MAGESCQLYPRIKGQDSELYKELSSDKFGGRPLANLMYAYYTQPGVRDAMDSAGYPRNPQGEHYAKDVFEFFDGSELINNQVGDLNVLAKNNGFKNSDFSFVDFDNYEEAYNKAHEFNTKNKGRIAYVVQHGDVFHVIVDDKTSYTQLKPAILERDKLAWDFFKQSLEAKGVDFGDLHFMRGTINPITLGSVFNYLKVLSSTADDRLSIDDIRLLMALNKNKSIVQQMISNYGDLESAANKVFEILQAKAPSGRYATIVNLMNQIKNLSHLDLASVKKALNKNIHDFENNSKEFTVEKRLKDFNARYKLNKELSDVTKKQIDKLTDAVGHAVMSLSRQIRVLETRQGTEEQTEELQKLMSELLTELGTKKNYAGMLKFLNKGMSYLSTIENILKNLPNTGSTFDQISARAEALVKLKNMINAYYNIAKSLSNVDRILFEESMTQQEIDNIKSIASTLEKALSNYSEVLLRESEQVTLEVCLEIFGRDSSIDAATINDFVQMASSDGSIFDRVYAFSQLSNPVAAALGTVFKEAQDRRRKRITDIARRIRVADSKLQKAGYDSSFMYDIIRDKSGKIISTYIKSDINWELYNKRRQEAIGRMRGAGLRGIDLKEAIRQWEEENTEPEIVDQDTGRTENLPSSIYRGLDFKEGWSAEQEEYYNTMMEIKGELGTLLPAYAQNHYMPVQVRGSALDVIKSIKQGRISFKEGMYTIYDNFRKWIALSIREDDAEYSKNSAIVGDEMFSRALSNYDNTIIKRIPIFYINPLENQSDLLFDFSASMQKLAATAISYDEMSKIQDVAEIMKSYIEVQRIKEFKNGMQAADIIENLSSVVVSRIVKEANQNGTAKIVQGLVDKYLYGENYKYTDGWEGWWDRLLRKLVKYNSTTKLATNLLSYANNLSMGEIQMLIEAGAGEYYNPKNLIRAHAILFGNNTIKMPGKIADMLTNNMYSMEALISERFDPSNETFGKTSNVRYHSTMFRRLFGELDVMSGYSSSEYFLQQLNLYAILDHEKVLINREEKSLYDAFERVENPDGSVELGFKENVTDLDGNPLTIDDEYVERIKKKVRTVIQHLNGAMNEEDKGDIHRTGAGKSIMSFRQWMIGHYSRRFRPMHWNPDTNRFEEGYYVTAAKAIAFSKFGSALGGKWIMRQLYRDINKFNTQMAIYTADKLPEKEKYNIKRAASEIVIWALLNLLSVGLGDEEDYKGEFWMRVLLYVLKRSIMETEASIPSPTSIEEVFKIVDSPVPALNTVEGLLYPITGLHEINEEYEKGRYKYKNKYWHKIKYKTLPFIQSWERSYHIDEDPEMFNYFDK